ncbi:MAG: hypothetical protein KC609_21550 [Myxococcales bacterium]|nr:hypothetical protein [Myxococcales bacterium]
MRRPLDQRFLDEARELDFRYTCRDCIHACPFDGHCSLLYPNDELLRAEFAVDSEGRLIFCKYFELT